jgi:hypothetical protein
MHRLAVLTGRQPAALVTTLERPVPLPEAPKLVSLGRPQDLLRRRPDISVAERNLAAAAARIGVATADLFPRVTFVGSITLEASSFTGLGSSGSDGYSFGPSIRWTALDLGRVRARIRQADARAEASVAQYELTVLRALEETENALVELGRQQPGATTSGPRPKQANRRLGWQNNASRKALRIFSRSSMRSAPCSRPKTASPGARPTPPLPWSHSTRPWAADGRSWIKSYKLNLALASTE